MKKQVIFSMLASLTPVGFSWLILLYLIHFGTREHIGYWGLLQAIALPIHLFFTFKLRVVQLVEYDNYKNSTFFYSRVFLALFSLVITFLYALIFLDLNYVYPIFFLALSYSFAIIREYYISVYQIHQKNEYFFTTNLVSSFSSFVGFISVYHFSNDISLAITCFSLLKIISCIIDFSFIKEKSYLNLNHINFKEIWVLLKKGAPLGVTVVMTSLLVTIPQIIIGKTLGLRDLGIFVSITSILSMFGIFFNSIFQVFLPQLSKLERSVKNRNLIKIFMSTLAGIIYFLIMGEKDLIYSKEVWLCILAANLSVLFSFGNFLLNLIKEFKIQPYLYAFLAAVIFVVNFNYLKDFGIILAIASICIVNMLGFLSCIFYFFIKDKFIYRK
jgi:O-antigen/teichoic acid export membrane protein